MESSGIKKKPHRFNELYWLDYYSGQQLSKILLKKGIVTMEILLNLDEKLFNKMFNHDLRWRIKKALIAYFNDDNHNEFTRSYRQSCEVTFRTITPRRNKNVNEDFKLVEGDVEEKPTKPRKSKRKRTFKVKTKNGRKTLVLSKSEYTKERHERVRKL